jgi:hypothetical protein
MPRPSKRAADQSRATSLTEQPSRGTKRYQLVLPEELFAAVQQLADERQTTVVDLIRRFIKLGLIAATVEETPGAALIIREGDTEQRIVLL